MTNLSRHINIPVFIPHEGCPNDCIFCNQRKISGRLKAPLLSEMETLIETHLKTKSPSDTCEIAFFGGSFTGLPLLEQEKYLKSASRYVRKGFVDGIRMSTRPDYVGEDVLRFLKKFPVKIIELGIQSLDNCVLEKSYRGYFADDVIRACQRVKQFGFSLGVQIMIGLPGDTREKSIQTARKIIAEKPDMLRIYPTLVIHGTGLELEYKAGRYRPLELDEAVDWCSELTPLYENAGITVLRIGLQHTEEIRQGGEVLAGPVHPAFGELVYSRILRNRIVDEIEGMDYTPGKSLVIHVSPQNVSKIIGQKRSNIQFLKERYGLLSVKVSGDRKEKELIVEFHD